MNAVAHQEFICPDITIERFESSDIDSDQFDHEAHVHVAWLYVREYELTEAIAKYESGLKRLVSKLGAEGKYHATLTWFFLLLIADRAEDGEPWQVFRHRNADIVTDSKKTLSRYYSDDHLFSKRARERFVLPDRLASNSD
jgi:hypothetical protein